MPENFEFVFCAAEGRMRLGFRRNVEMRADRIQTEFAQARNQSPCNAGEIDSVIVHVVGEFVLPEHFIQESKLERDVPCGQYSFR